MSQSEQNDARSGKTAQKNNDPLMGQLKSMYDDVAAEPLPTELISLLEKLDEAERKR